jgi:hypothetical protein
MSVRWFPCRWCGESAAGVDTYVLCAACLAELQARGVLARPPEKSVHVPLTPREEANVRRLLDW